MAWIPITTPLTTPIEAATHGEIYPRANPASLIAAAIEESLNNMYVAAKPQRIVRPAETNVAILRSLCGSLEPFLKRTKAIPSTHANKPHAAKING